ncbi:hypothetical protein EJ08DRAFT_605318 [Tothia fuscella]|uniref:Uncharacterized protein n=1 Tax=Tothia fuscella TaxID=1048955 RepID=A0A9P4P133_9PEZI|nr:hypothetical protein EJ08DRAFT_605318 [Tothia fuscella]
MSKIYQYRLCQSYIPERQFVGRLWHLNQRGCCRNAINHRGAPGNVVFKQSTRQARTKHHQPVTVLPFLSRQLFSSFNITREQRSGEDVDRINEKKSSADEKPRLLDKVKNRVSKLTPYENIYNVPNILTLSRLLATPAIGYLVLHDQHVWAVGLFAYAGVTDLLDGWIARKWNLQTVAGSVIDPMADKFLMTVLVGCLAAKGALPLWMAALIFGRDMSLGFGAIYYRYASLPEPKTFMRYWDFSIPSAEVHPTTVSKWNTLFQLGLIGATLTLPVLNSSVLPSTLAEIDFDSGLKAMQYLVAATTLWSGASYTWNKDAVVILGTKEELKRKQGFRGRMILGVSMAAFLALAVELRRREKRAQTGNFDDSPK